MRKPYPYGKFRNTDNIIFWWDVYKKADQSPNIIVKVSTTKQAELIMTNLNQIITEGKL